MTRSICVVVATLILAACGNADRARGDVVETTQSSSGRANRAQAKPATGAPGYWSAPETRALSKCGVTPSAPATNETAIRIDLGGKGLSLDRPDQGHIVSCGLQLSIPLRNAATLPKRPVIVDIRYFEQAGDSADDKVATEVTGRVNGLAPKAIEDPVSGEGLLRFELPAELVAAQGRIDVALIATATRQNDNGRARIEFDRLEIDCPRRGRSGCGTPPKPPAKPPAAGKAQAVARPGSEKGVK